MEQLTHLSLFSGFGGLDLAAEWAGFKTVGQCEYADYPTKVLEKHWPDVPRWRDIRTLTGESFYERTGLRTVDIISGGFPCQPFSVAGKQRGKEDDRYLWPEMVRVIKELRPTWVVGENVAGIIKMALPEILDELEGCGYRTRTFLIPACAVGARHRRYRVAIVGRHTDSRDRNQGQEQKMESREDTQSPGTCTDISNPNSNGRRSRGNNREERYLSYNEERNFPESKQKWQGWEHRTWANGKDMADTEKQQRYGNIGTRAGRSGFTDRSKDVQYTRGTGYKELHLAGEPNKQGFLSRGCDEGNVSDADNTTPPRFRKYSWKIHGETETERPDRSGKRGRAVESGMGMLANGIPTGMGGCIDLDFIINHYWDIEPDIPRVATGIKNRIEKLKGFGNAVVPQQFYPVFHGIRVAEKMILEVGE